MDNTTQPLIHNGWQYFHSQIITSPFGGKMIEARPQRHNIKTKEIVLISDWNTEILKVIDEIGDDKFDNTIWDLDYHNPFIDYR